MKNRELIERLQQMDPEADVRIDVMDDFYSGPVKSVEEWKTETRNEIVLENGR